MHRILNSTLLTYTTLFRSAKDRSTSTGSLLDRMDGCQLWSGEEDIGTAYERFAFDRPPSRLNVAPSPAPYTTWALKSRSEEHTSELQSRGHLVCCLLREKK